MENRRQFLRKAAGALAASALGSVPNVANAGVAYDAPEYSPDKFFTKFDPDKTGKVNIDYLVNREISERKSSSEIHPAVKGLMYMHWRKFDLNGDNIITREEYTKKYQDR